MTPSHDENDYKLGEKHKLQSIDIFDDEGKLMRMESFMLAKIGSR